MMQTVAVIKCNNCETILICPLPITLDDSKCSQCGSWCSENVIGFKMIAARIYEDIRWDTYCDDHNLPYEEEHDVRPD